MKAATIWLAIILATSTSFAIGIALGGRPDFPTPSIVKFVGEWQSLIGAVITIFAMGATLQAGWWALSGAREQILTAKDEARIRDENRYQAVKSITLVNLNKIVRFSTESIKYIYEKKPSLDPIEIEQNVIENLALLVEAGRSESCTQAASLIREIQLCTSWVYDIQFTKEKVGNAVPVAALHCLLLYAKCMKWYDFARGEDSSINDELTHGDIKSAIRIFSTRNDLEFTQDEDELEDLQLEISRHFKIYLSEEETTDSSDNI